MACVKMLKPYLIPLFGWLPQGVEVTLPDPVAAAMVLNRYAEYIVSEAPAARWAHKAVRVKVNVEEEPPAATGAGEGE